MPIGKSGTTLPWVNVLEGSQMPNPIPNCLKNCDLSQGRGKRRLFEIRTTGVRFSGKHARVRIPGAGFLPPADGSTYQTKGWYLYSSPELLRGTQLGRHIKAYTFFSYDVHEALHLSMQDHETIIDCLKKIDDEINNGARTSTATRS